MMTKPMKAATIEPEDIDKLRFPLLATPKIDGIRCLRPDHRIVSNSFKPIPNEYIKNQLHRNLPVGADGEIYIPGIPFNEISSAVMNSHFEHLNFRYAMFDIYNADTQMLGYKSRTDYMKELAFFADNVDILIPIEIRNHDELTLIEGEMLKAGYEGVMLRSPDSPYKMGRSTFKQHWLMKLKRFKDSEALIIGYYPLESNQNEAFKDELGHSKRSSHQANKVTQAKLGGFEVRDVHTGITFKIGSGFDDALRESLWEGPNTNRNVNRIVKYRFQQVGTHEKPRFPTFIGFRSKEDM